MRVQPTDGGLIRQEILRAMAATRSDCSLSGQKGRLDGGPDAFAALWVGEAGGITDEHETVSDDGTRADARREIRMSAPLEPGRPRRFAAAFQKPDEVIDVGGEMRAVAPPQPNVQVLALSHAPAVSFEIVAEEELSDVWRNRTDMPIESILRFFRHDRAWRRGAIAEAACHRTEVSAGTDHKRRPDLFVGYPDAAVAPERGERGLLEDAHAGPAQKELVELPSTDRITHDGAVWRLDRRPAQEACDEIPQSPAASGRRRDTRREADRVVGTHRA